MTLDPRRRLEDRVEDLERRNIGADAIHSNLERADSLTARAIGKLTEAINDPRLGLIVELDRFRTEVRTDRRIFRAWIRGATAVLGFIFGIVTVAAPWIREWVAHLLAIQTP